MSERSGSSLRSGCEEGTNSKSARECFPVPGACSHSGKSTRPVVSANLLVGVMIPRVYQDSDKLVTRATYGTQACISPNDWGQAKSCELRPSTKVRANHDLSPAFTACHTIPHDLSSIPTPRKNKERSSLAKCACSDKSRQTTLTSQGPRGQ